MIIQILNTINDDIKQIRTDVFMKEQGFENEFDEIDEIAKFVLLSIDGKPVGTCRFFPSDIEGDAHIGRMAVRKLYRGQNLGSKIMLAAENGIRRDGFNTCSLSAQVQAKPFYESLGYKAEGEEYLDEGCPHVMMRKNYNIEVSCHYKYNQVKGVLSDVCGRCNYETCRSITRTS